MSELDELQSWMKSHDCNTCKASDDCMLKLLLPQMDEIGQYCILHASEVNELLESSEEFMENAMDFIADAGPLLLGASIKVMFFLFLTIGFIRGKQYVEVPDAYKE